MKAGVFHGHRDIRVEDIPKPKIRESKDVLVRVKYCGICGTELHAYRGKKDEFEKNYKLPVGTVLGHEISGEVVEVGKEVKQVKVGEDVAIEPFWGCGNCSQCRVGNYHNCTQGRRITKLPLTGGFAEYTLTTEDKVYTVPDNVSEENAALLDGLAVGVHAVHHSHVCLNDNTAIFGAGTIGLSLAALVKDNARTTYLVAMHPLQKKVGECLGVTKVLDATENTVQELLDLTGGDGLDFAFEAIGGKGATIQQALASVGACGTAVALGHFQAPVEIDSFRLVAMEKRLQGLHAYALWGSDTEFQLAMDALASGKFDLNPLITHRYPLEKIDKAFRFATGEGRGNVIKIMLEI